MAEAREGDMGAADDFAESEGTAVRPATSEFFRGLACHVSVQRFTTGHLND
jgi:hypothetical protein